MRTKSLLALAVCSVLGAGSLSFADDKMDDGKMADVVTYEITITNLTTGQPFSPPVAVTHPSSMHLFEMGKKATPELQLVAEMGMTEGIVKMCADKATDVVAAGMDDKIMPGKSLTLKIKAKPGDVLSLAAMVAATNDGFFGLDGCPLDEKGMMEMKEKMKDKMGDEGGAMMMMKDGVMTIEASAMDAGTEENTEKKTDTAAPDMGKGHPGTNPQGVITKHEGIKGTGDLDKEKFGWTGPVAKIVVKKAAM